MNTGLHGCRDGKRLFTSVYVPKDDSQPSPILMDRTPYSVGPYGEDAYQKIRWALRRVSKGRVHFRVPRCARQVPCPKVNSWRCTRTLTVKHSTADVDDSHGTRTTRSEFLLKHVANNNGKVGIWGISYPGFYTAASINRLASGAESCVSTSADDRFCSLLTTLITVARSMAGGETSGFYS